MKFFRRQGATTATIIWSAVIVMAVWISYGSTPVEAGLTAGAPIHTHSGTSTGGAAITRANISNASGFTLSTSNDANIFAITNTTTGKIAQTTATGRAAVYLDANALTENGLTSPVVGNYTNGTNTGYELRTATVDATDNAITRLCSSGSCGEARGGHITLYGNETAQAGDVGINSGNAAGSLIGLSAGTSNILIYYGQDVAITAASSNINLFAASGTVTTDTRIVSTASCASGYSRKTPNYCQRTGALSATSLVRDTCTAIAAPANSTMLSLNLFALLTASGSPVVAVRETFAFTYSDAACTTIINQINHQSLQRLADANGGLQYISQATESGPNVSGSYYVRFTDDAGNANTVTYSINGYYD